MASTDANTWIIYGANGYTGRLCAEEAIRRGTRPILAGRNAETIGPLAESLGLEPRVFSLDNPDASASALQDVGAVLHCAGPFSATARPMLEACCRTHTHYLDITGEIDIFEYVHGNPQKWRDAGITAIPGVGFDIVPTDCLAAMLARALPTATHLRLAFKSGSGKMSPGTTKTVLESLAQGCRIRRDGRIVDVPLAYTTETFPFADGPALCVAIPWGDVSTAFFSTGVPNIEVFTAAPPKQIRGMKRLDKFRWFLGNSWVQSFLKRRVTKTVTGPDEAERASDQTQLYGEALDANGRRTAITMQTPNGYALTVDAAVTCIARILQGGIPPGPATPSSAFGPDFVLELDGVRIQDVPPQSP